jgi:hypothetical protein
VNLSSAVLARSRRSPALAGLFVIVVAGAVACDSGTSALPLLTDPAEIVMAAVRSTAALRGVHARVEVSFQDGQALGGPAPAGISTFELDLDMATRDYAGRTINAGGGGIGETSEIIHVGGQQFNRSGPNARWTQFPDFGGVPFPTNDDLVATIGTAIGGGGAQLRLADPESCGDATCYHVIAELDKAATWRLIAPLTGGRAGGPPPPDFPVPALTIDLLVHQATRALIQARTTVTTQGTSIDLAVTLSNHDVEVVIVPPPPAMVDNVGVGIPQPVPADPAPPTPQPASPESPQP